MSVQILQGTKKEETSDVCASCAMFINNLRSFAVGTDTYSLGVMAMQAKENGQIQVAFT